MSNSQLDFGVDLDYDKKKQVETEFQERLKVYKYKFAKKFKIIKYSLFLLQLVNVSIHWSFFYLDFISKLTSKSTDSTKVYNHAMSKTIDTALQGIFVLIIANFILLCLFSLSTSVANY